MPLPMVKLECPYERRIFPYLLNPLTARDELWLMGRDGYYGTIHSELDSTLLQFVLPTSSVLVPDAPIEVLSELAQFLHTGRQGRYDCVILGDLHEYVRAGSQ